MSLGHRIRQLRQARGLTQSQLGGPEISKSFISLLEKDIAKPSLDTLLLIARRLGTSVDSLLGQNGNIPEMVCEGLLSLSREAIEHGEFEDGTQYLFVVDFLATKYDLKEAACEALLQEGQIALEGRQFSVAWAKFEAARDISGEQKDEWRTGRALLMQGVVKLRQREFPPAVGLLEQSLAKFRRAKASRDPARVEALIFLGTTHGYMGNYTRAIRAYKEAARSDVVEHNLKLRGRALWGIGLAERKLANHESAKAYLLEAKDAFERAEELRDLMLVYHNIGQLLQEQGRSREALRHFHHALRVAEQMGNLAHRASILTEIAQINAGLGNVEDAAHFAEQALVQSISINDPVYVAEAKMAVAQVRLKQHNEPAAIELMKDALAIFRDRKMQGKVAFVARELGLLLRARGAHAKAAEYLALSLDQGSAAEGAHVTAEVSE